MFACVFPETHDVNSMMKQCYEIQCVHASTDGTEKLPVDCLQKGCDETGGQCFNPEVTALSEDMKPARQYTSNSLFLVTLRPSLPARDDDGRWLMHYCNFK